MSKITILAIETSCDETGVAVVTLEKEEMRVLHQSLASQIDIHQATGGVVPEVAAREHVVALQPMIKQALQETNIEGENLSAIGVTFGPGLMPALAVGVNAARALSFGWQKPIVPVHHIEGHIYSALLANPDGQFPEHIHVPAPADVFPALALIVSGGHTQLILVKDHLTYHIVGETMDDAAGEAFDKVARLLELPYPGGPAISKIAEHGNPVAFDLPRPLIQSDNLNFSFSGLKTAVLYTVRDLPPEQKKTAHADLAASFEQAVVDVLVHKTRAAIKEYTPRTLLLAGGVAANKKLRKTLENTSQQTQVPLRIAPKELCGDNAVMIGQVAVIAFQKGRSVSWQEITPQARPPLSTVAQVF
jgi:N6-L-threonylcarbamoyladenine synthase